ncbi:MAG: zinc-ribbon domain-containing protein, partial [Chloroflexota bacterium]
MRAARSTDIRCVNCGATNSPGATTCVVCGRPLAAPGEAGGDPMANSVGGAPVPQTPRDLQGGLQEAGDRIEPLLRDAAGMLSDRLARRRSLPPAARRLQMHLDHLARRPPPYVPPPPAPPLALRAAWYVVAGVVCTLLWIVAAWLVLISVVGRTIAARMLERTPAILTAHIAGSRPPAWMTTPVPYRPPYPAPRPPTSPGRVLYFLLIGWWASLV